MADLVETREEIIQNVDVLHRAVSEETDLNGTGRLLSLFHCKNEAAKEIMR